MKYLFDNCISPRYAKMLQALDVDVVALRELFSANIQDEELFQRIRGSQYVFLTADTSQKTREKEARGLREAGVTALFLGPFWGRLTLWQQAGWLVNKWPTVDGFARGAEKGTCAEIKQNGRCNLFRI